MVGCGGAGLLHAQSYLKAGVELVGVCDLDPVRAGEAGQRFGVPAFATAADLLRTRPGIVSVTTAEPHHVEPVVAALATGTDVLCEKIMADSVAGGRRIVEAVGASAGRLAVDYNYRFVPVARAIRATLAAGRLGTVSAASISTHSYCWHHTLDLVRFWFGPVTSVRAARGATPGRERVWAGDDVVYLPDPAVAVVLSTAAGAVVSLTSTLDSPLAESMISVSLFGDRGRLVVDRMRLADVNGEVRDGELEPVDGLDEPFSLDDSFAASIAAVVAAERAGTPFPTSHEDGWEMVRLEAAVATSVRDRREVRL